MVSSVSGQDKAISTILTLGFARCIPPENGDLYRCIRWLRSQYKRQSKLNCSSEKRDTIMVFFFLAAYKNKDNA